MTIVLILALAAVIVWLIRRLNRAYAVLSELLMFTAGLYEMMKRNGTLSPNEANWALCGIYNARLIFKGKPATNEYEDTGGR